MSLRFSPSLYLILVCKDIVTVWQYLSDLVFEKLRDESCGEAEHKNLPHSHAQSAIGLGAQRSQAVIYLVLRSSFLCQRHRRRHAHCQLITLPIEHAAFLDHGPYPWLHQMLNLVLIRRRQMRTHGTLMARDHNATPPGRFLLVDQVLDMDALLVAFLA